MFALVISTALQNRSKTLSFSGAGTPVTPGQCQHSREGSSSEKGMGGIYVQFLRILC
jgi:hypothetical protein